MRGKSVGKEHVGKFGGNSKMLCERIYCALIVYEASFVVFLIKYCIHDMFFK